jgi:hypothetical protein
VGGVSLLHRHLFFFGGGGGWNPFPLKRSGRYRLRNVWLGTFVRQGSVLKRNSMHAVGWASIRRLEKEKHIGEGLRLSETQRTGWPSMPEFFSIARYLPFPQAHSCTADWHNTQIQHNTVHFAYRKQFANTKVIATLTHVMEMTTPPLYRTTYAPSGLSRRSWSTRARRRSFGTSSARLRKHLDKGGGCKRCFVTLGATWE